MLSDIRKLKGLSQAQLSNLSGVSLRMIQKYEQGDKDIDKAQGLTLHCLSQALNCKMEDLILKDVVNCRGTRIDFEVAVGCMDDEIREDLHSKLAPCSDQVFFTVYEKAHEEKFSETWELSKSNPVW